MLRPRLNQRIWLRLSSVFESRRTSFLKIFLVSSCIKLCQVMQLIEMKCTKSVVVFCDDMLTQENFFFFLIIVFIFCGGGGGGGIKLFSN